MLEQRYINITIMIMSAAFN